MNLTWANRITVVRILLIAPFVILMLHNHDPQYGAMFRYIALGLFVVMAVSDGVDGYLARKYKQATRLGAFLDPMGDKMLMASALLLLASKRACVQGFDLPDWVVVLVIGKDLFLLMGFIIVYFTTMEVRVVPAYIGKVATVLQLLLVIGILIAPEVSKVMGQWIWVLRFFWWSAAITATVATLIYIWQGIRYVEQFEQHKVNGNNKAK